MEVRSYSPISGETAAEVVTHVPSHCSRTASAAACSCESFTKEFMNAMAIASTLWLANCSSTESRSFRSTGWCSVPSESMRPGTVARRYRGTSTGAYGARWFHWSSRIPRRISSVSRNPSVPISPTTAPVPSSMVLVATVEPWTNSEQPVSTSPSGMPRSTATRASAACTPRLGSAGTEGTFATHVAPRASARTRSVKVPPTSTPIRHGAVGRPVGGQYRQ